MEGADEELELSSGVVQRVELVSDLFCSMSYCCSGCESQFSMRGIWLSLVSNWQWCICVVVLVLFAMVGLSVLWLLMMMLEATVG